jgi:hypothetical protein
MQCIDRKLSSIAFFFALHKEGIKEMKEIIKQEKTEDQIISELKSKYGDLIVAKLPEYKVYFRKLNPGEFDAMQTNLHNNNSRITSIIKDTISSACVYPSGAFDLIHNKYPAAIGNISLKIMEASGSNIEVDFLD